MAYKYQKLLDKLRQDEGFEPNPYKGPPRQAHRGYRLAVAARGGGRAAPARV